MALSYEEAVALLYRVPLESFVEERKRLAAQLKGEGDKASAARLAARARPPVSAWVVNQMWWQGREEIEGLFSAAARQRTGDRAAASEHRERLAGLRARAAELLRAAGHAATEATLRRVTTTLAALAVLGSFAPDEPGALSADRDPPGFDALALGDVAAPPLPERRSAEPGKREKREKVNDGASAVSVNDVVSEQSAARRAEEHRAARAEAERRAAEAEAERRRKEAERLRIEKERERLTTEFEQARGEFDACEQAASERRRELRAAEAAAERARVALNEARSRLKEFERKQG